VGVVAAGVHHADFASAVGRARRRCEGQSRLFGDGEGVHVGAQRDDRSVSAPAQHADHAGVRDAGAHLEPQSFEVLRDECSGAHLAVAELGVPVDVAAPCDDARMQRARGPVDGFAQRVLARGGRGRDRQGDREQELPAACPGAFRR
jgi:hypothetical protein